MKEEFLQELLNTSISFMASKWLLDRIPFIFGDDRELYIRWKEKLAKEIGVDSKSMAFTGSASCGFSLNPNKNYKNFDKTSDIDIAIISEYYFNISWRSLRNIGTKRFDLNPLQQASLADHVNRYIYWGTIATDKILEILPFGKEWSISLLDMAKVQPANNREINIRIYKDFESLRAYQINNLRNLRTNFLENI